MKKELFLLFSLIIFYSCSSTKNTKLNTIVSTAEKEKTNALQSSGVDFLAEGNFPSNWTLQINKDDTVRFFATDGLTIKFAYNQLKKEIKVDTVFYSTMIKGGLIKIKIINKKCSLISDKEPFANEVFFIMNANTYYGCGKFLVNSNLNGKWILEKIENSLVKASEYNQIPNIEFELNKSFVNGNDGCNNFGGKIQIEGKSIRFNELFTTEMFCENKNIAQIISSKVANKLVDYYLKDGKLYFYLIDDGILVFVKKN